MQELLQNYNNDDAQYSLLLDRNNLINFVKTCRSSALNFTQWCEAYDILGLVILNSIHKLTVELIKDNINL